MQVSLTFNFKDTAEAADFLANANGQVATQVVVNERPPWDDDEDGTSEPERDAKASADPWADETTPTRPSKPQKPAQSHTHPASGKLFPSNGEYTRDSPSGDRKWEFGVDGAPECDCGYPAAKVTGKKGKREWSAFWCPVGFTKDWKNKCGFSEFV